METFEAHGRTWTKHGLMDGIPRTGNRLIEIIGRDGKTFSGHALDFRWYERPYGKVENEIIGWRYATPQPQEPDELTKALKRDTPRTDDHTYGGKGIIGAGYVSADFARSLERELTTLRAERELMLAAIREAHVALQAQQDFQDAEDMGRNGIAADDLRIAALTTLSPFTESK